ncbi:hypothetical protein RFM98_02745 [Mesorhizobium sp. VK9D]|uniref:hypothetical protein n=1 Tax=Mesorhizobium australafricanum TaxID=3072311 RepID=UPI002A239CEF|nr:hypothetical protein [Mesorhizobium sp. VK9D]MDX8451665.1 hypothetical protein [Mesorhizobium sp. VK9D]
MMSSETRFTLFGIMLQRLRKSCSHRLFKTTIIRDRSAVGPITDLTLVMAG